MPIVKQHAHRIKFFFLKMNLFLLSVQLIASLKALFAVYIDVKVTPYSSFLVCEFLLVNLLSHTSRYAA